MGLLREPLLNKRLVDKRLSVTFWYYREIARVLSMRHARMADALEPLVEVMQANPRRTRVA
ncbi:MAG TPA: hypothetical protein VFS86_08140 [Rhodanobacteraceae bacterium]|jgi:hypothetical protein|nr:hypothetical protein [Rhodanobacteraceae bacterium]